MSKEHDIHDEKLDQESSSDQKEDSGQPTDSDEESIGDSVKSDESRDDMEQLKKTLQRVQADFVNFRRRADEDKENYQKYSTGSLILRLLPVIDELDLAISHTPTRKTPASWIEGVRLIYRKLYSLLESEGITRIEAEGKSFDPFEHEAMSLQEATDYPEGCILSVVRAGYKLHGKVLRPSQVIVSKQPTNIDETPNTSQQ